MTEPIRVLLVDDDANFCTAMSKALRRRGFIVESVLGGSAAVPLLAGEGVADVAVLDLRMPDLDGLSVLRQTAGRRTPVIVLTGHGTVPDAVEAMRLGAHTFITKPVDAGELGPIIAQAASPALADEPALVGEDASTAQLRQLLTRLADADETVLLTGETGTGKEVAARTLHALSRRASAPFIAVNMACLPANLIESELFGHARGAFTGAARRKAGLFEEVGEGTLFLDEVAELPLEHQAKLLRVLEAREFRPVGETNSLRFTGRLVAATHRRLVDEVAAGRFREDLFYRLQVLPLEIPPLRARLQDIVPIAKHWIERVSPTPLTLEEGAAAVLLAHEWPGNVREVVNLARRVALFAEGGVVDAPLVHRMLAANPFTRAAFPPRPSRARGAPPEEVSLEALERRHIVALLEHHRNITKVARILEINRRTLQRKLKAWGLDQGDLGGA